MERMPPVERVSPEEKIPRLGPLELNLNQRSLTNTETGVSERLSKSEYQVLWLLIRAKGSTVNRAPIEEFLYADRPEDEDWPISNGVDVFIARLRKKLSAVAGEKVVIETRGSVSRAPALGWALELRRSQS
jgi:DNA-binding response OmpR family regulator